MGQRTGRADAFPPTKCRLAGAALRLAAVAALLSGAATGDWRSRPPTLERHPRLIVGDSVGADFAALALETWDRFLAVFWARRHCFGDVHLRAAYALDSRAGYDPDTATVTVQVPGTPAMLQSGLIHEWAHHLESQCQEHLALRPAFLAAQGLPPDTPWRSGDVSPNLPASDWSAMPSEQYAEAAIELVLGGRPIPTRVRVSQEAVRVLGAWAAGD